MNDSALLSKSSQRHRPLWILPAIIFSQFTGTSLWFSGNAVSDELKQILHLPPSAIGYLTSSVNMGFVFGTLLFAFFTISDRWSPRRVFFVCSILGAISNLGIYLFLESYSMVLISRFFTGFFLAGIYPVGVKIASGWYREGLGQATSFLLFALVVGTGFPHLLKSMGHQLPWSTVVWTVSVASVLGGVLMLVAVKDGPYLAHSSKFNPIALLTIFKDGRFRASAFGYFGHMWEIYTLWAFTPFIIQAHATIKGVEGIDASFWTFLVMGIGAIGCVIGGFISIRTGSAPVAFVQLSTSGLCCLASVFMFEAPTWLFLTFMIFWGVAAVSDSPQFLTLVASNSPEEYMGTALTFANCIGFIVSIISIQFTGSLLGYIEPRYILLPLMLGPALGILGMTPVLRSNTKQEKS